MNKQIFSTWRNFGLDPIAVINQKFPIGKEVNGFAGLATVVGYTDKFTNASGQVEIAYINPKIVGRKADVITISNLMALN